MSYGEVPERLRSIYLFHKRAARPGVRRPRRRGGRGGRRAAARARRRVHADRRRRHPTARVDARSPPRDRPVRADRRAGPARGRAGRRRAASRSSPPSGPSATSSTALAGRAARPPRRATRWPRPTASSAPRTSACCALLQELGEQIAPALLGPPRRLRLRRPAAALRSTRAASAGRRRRQALDAGWRDAAPRAPLKSRRARPDDYRSVRRMRAQAATHGRASSSERNPSSRSSTSPGSSRSRRCSARGPPGRRSRTTSPTPTRPATSASDVDFHSVLEQALADGSVARRRRRSTSPPEPDGTGATRADGSNVDLDIEMASLAENSLEYQALAHDPEDAHAHARRP